MAGGDELRRLAERLRQFPRDFAEEAGEISRKAIREPLLAATGGDASLSNAPGKLTVEVDLSGGRARMTAGGGAQWKWLQEGTMPHMVGPRSHPGSPAKEVWSKGTEAAIKRIERVGPHRFEEAVNG